MHASSSWPRLDGSRDASPYNDPDVIAGQRALARELLEQVPNLGTVVVPCGGGGLLAGVTLGLERDGRTCRRVSSPRPLPLGAPRLPAGAIVPIDVEPTVADGLAGNLEPGAVTVDIVLGYGVEVLTVSEADIRSAMAFAATKMGFVLEGAGAVGVAALRAGVITPDHGGEGDRGAPDRSQSGPRTCCRRCSIPEANVNGVTLGYEVSGEGYSTSADRGPRSARDGMASVAGARLGRRRVRSGDLRQPWRGAVVLASRPLTASTSWRPTPSPCSTISGGPGPCASWGTPWVGGSPRRWCSTAPNVCQGRRARRAAPTSRRPGRSPSRRWSGTWPGWTTTGLLVFYATETLRYLPIADIQDPRSSAPGSR